MFHVHEAPGVYERPDRDASFPSGGESIVDSVF